MTDVRQQLTEALDEIEREVRAALDPADRWWWKVPESPAERHISRWRPEFVLRLVERDRRLLTDLDAVRQAVEANRDRSVSNPFTNGRAQELEIAAERAAAFWVGTPECRPRAPRPRPAGEASAATTTPRRSTGPLCSYGPCECCGTSEVDR